MQFLTIEELKNLDVDEAVDYCSALRNYVTENVMVSGGHLASNLGVTEISVALMRLFDSPKDKIIYDVGHQSYVHKLLTNRIFDGTNLRKLDGFSGFTKRDESEHDPFGAGHSSTAFSAALGFSRAARLKGEDSWAVAVIGDGAFCTGMTFEALNNVRPDDKIIIILNDNEMSISEPVGAMSKYFNRIRLTKKYFNIKKKTKYAVRKAPWAFKLLSKAKYFIKRLLIKPNMFEDLGIYYMGPADGNDLSTVETLLAEAKSRNAPVLLHFKTTKGKGLLEAEENPGKYHFVPFSSSAPTFSSEYARILTEYSEKDDSAVAITAAMCDGTGLCEYKKTFPDRLFDVGISEEHAATFAAALSAGGMLPFYTVYSTFFQRSYDQIIHDIALQKLKVVVALDRAGLVGADGATHHGLFDVSMMLNVPGSEIYSPATFGDLEYAFNKCTEYNGLSVLRYPRGTESNALAHVFSKPADFSFDSSDFSDVLIVTYGRITEEALKAKLMLASKGYKVAILKFTKLKPIDFKQFETLINKTSPKLVCILEEGMKTGGFGEYFLSNVKLNSKTEIFAIDEEFVPQGTIDELYDLTAISGAKIYSRIIKCL